MDGKIANRTKRLLFKIYLWLHRYLHRIHVLPISRRFGLERGSPVGRFYVEAFLQQNRKYVRGRCLEFGDARYKTYFQDYSSYEIVNVEAGSNIDYVCDIHDVSKMPQSAFDTIICTQVFEHLEDPQQASHSLFQLLAPGGTLLITAPFINNVHYDPTDFHRFTPDGLELILRNAGLGIDNVDFGGNSLVSTGSLLGMVQEDFTREELEYKDPVYPYNVLIRAHRPSE